jgi:Flp pilus assembly pilin Flp
MKVNKNRVRKGQALVEYTIILAAVALISLGTISLLGHKTTDMLGTLTAILPGAHTNDNGPIAAGELVPTTANGAGAITVDVQAAASSTTALDNNLFGTGTGDSPLLIETN